MCGEFDKGDNMVVCQEQNKIEVTTERVKKYESWQEMIYFSKRRD